MPHSLTRRITEGAVIAALYVVLTYASRLFGLADGAIQFRLSELLTVLPAFTPAAIPGLTVGCLLANLGSPYGPADILSGTAATLLAAIGTYLLRRVRIKGIPALAPLPPVLCNGVIVGAVVAVMNEAGQLIPSAFTWPAFLLTALTVALGELAVCVLGGYPLMLVLRRHRFFDHLDKT